MRSGIIVDEIAYEKKVIRELWFKNNQEMSPSERSALRVKISEHEIRLNQLQNIDK